MLYRQSKVSMTKNIKNVRQLKPHQWYSTLKYLSNFDRLKTKDPIVEDIKNLPDQDQTALIVKQISKVVNLFDELKSCDITTQEFDEKDIPQVSQLNVRFALRRLKTNKLTDNRQSILLMNSLGH